MLTKGARGIAGDDLTWGHITGDHGHRAHNAVCAQREAGQHESARAHKSTAPDHDGPGLQRQLGLRKIVRTRAEIGLLRDGRTLVEHDAVERVGSGPIAKARAMMQYEVPRLLDARMLVYKWSAVDFRAKELQHQ